MENNSDEIKSYKIVDEYLAKLKKEALPILEVKNKAQEYRLALNIILEHGLIQQVKNNRFTLSDIGNAILNSEGVEKNMAMLINRRELKDDLRLKKIQLDIGKHIESRRFNILLIILGLVLFIFLIVLKFFFL
jgi:hypothetical protein